MAQCNHKDLSRGRQEGQRWGRRCNEVCVCELKEGREEKEGRTETEIEIAIDRGREREHDPAGFEDGEGATSQGLWAASRS